MVSIEDARKIIVGTLRLQGKDEQADFWRSLPDNRLRTLLRIHAHRGNPQRYPLPFVRRDDRWVPESPNEPITDDELDAAGLGTPS